MNVVVVVAVQVVLVVVEVVVVVLWSFVVRAVSVQSPYETTNCACSRENPATISIPSTDFVVVAVVVERFGSVVDDIADDSYRYNDVAIL
jgi:hypothetical protein